MPALFIMQAMPNTNKDFKGFDDYIELFRSGEQTSSNGITQNFTNADLDEMVVNHSPAPAVVGHPKDNDPSYGWTQELKREGDVLLGKFSDVDKAFSKMVENKRFPNRSVRIAKGGNGWFLKHVGWLGAAAPGVEGLKPVSFSQNDAPSFDFISEAYATNVMARTFRRLREFLITQFDVETADQVLPDYEIEGLTEAAVEQRINNNNSDDPLFNEPTGGQPVTQYTDAQISKLQKDAADAAVASFSAEKTDLENQLAQSKKEKLKVDFQKTTDELIEQGKLTPAMASGMVEFMASLIGGEVELEFSQGEGDKKTNVKKSPIDWFNDFAKQLPKQVDMSESDAGDDLEKGSTSSFSAPAGSVVDADRLALHNKAEDYMKKNDCGYFEAVTAVS